MPRSDPSLGVLGALLASGGLLTLILGEGLDPLRLGAAIACLIAALLVFAVDALLRMVRRTSGRAEAGTVPEPARRDGVVMAGRLRLTRLGIIGAPIAGEPSAAPAAGAEHHAALASVRARRGARAAG